MIFYDIMVEYELEKSVQSESEDINEQERRIGTRMNKNLKVLSLDENFITAYVYVIEKDKFDLAVSAKAEIQITDVWKLIKERLSDSMNMSCKLKKAEEITVEGFRSIIVEGDSNNLLRSERRILQMMKLDYNDNCTFKLEETMYCQKKQGVKAAVKRANELMAGTDYLEEIKRIYSKENMKQFYGHPVHYHISAGNEKSMKAMLELLILSLHNNKRILSGRVNHIVELTERCYEERDFENLIRSSVGATVVLPMNYSDESEAEYASAYSEMFQYVGKLIKKYHRKVLFIFAEISTKKGYATSMIQEVGDELRIVELSEGTGNRQMAQKILCKLIDDSEYKCLRDALDEERIPQQDFYKLSEIYKYYEEWIDQKIYQKAYKTYAIKTTVKVTEEKKKGTAYEKLQDLVGLQNIKELVEQIVAMDKIQSMRYEMGLVMQRNAMHMIFTGNPGSAKTTVARLLTSILKEEGIIRNGNLVECGRADLVGKYVGWTAKQVEKKFKEAMDGVLFIDEAYSLVDDRSGSFGDEAIHTIVQEMENHRSDVIVIFAGYPEKMKQFLNKNEGLRSRIAFHLDFPDYNETEMVEILKLMVREKGYLCSDVALEKCRGIFAKAVLQEEFGNGRYVRNVLEQAMMKQSRRLMSAMTGKEISKEQIQQLLPEDFDVAAGNIEKKRVRIGYDLCNV